MKVLAELWGRAQSFLLCISLTPSPASPHDLLFTQVNKENTVYSSQQRKIKQAYIFFVRRVDSPNSCSNKVSLRYSSVFGSRRRRKTKVSLFFPPPFSSFYCLSSAVSSCLASSLRVIPLLGLCWFSRRFAFKTLPLLVYLSVLLLTWMSCVYLHAYIPCLCPCMFVCFLSSFFFSIRTMFSARIPV